MVHNFVVKVRMHSVQFSRVTYTSLGVFGMLTKEMFIYDRCTGLLLHVQDFDSGAVI